MQFRKTMDYETGRTLEVAWKASNPDCPNCLGSRHVVMSPTGYGERIDSDDLYWAPCPCCSKTFAPQKLKEAA